MGAGVRHQKSEHRGKWLGSRPAGSRGCALPSPLVWHCGTLKGTVATLQGWVPEGWGDMGAGPPGGTTPASHLPRLQLCWPHL